VAADSNKLLDLSSAWLASRAESDVSFYDLS
jgi:hypothetical protein